MQHVNTLTSAVTTAWGVDWDVNYIARDLMQNFFDANRGRLSEVRVETQGSDVMVTAPTPFNLQRLFYLGSEKGEDDVGQYGEGFKVAATCLLRDHAVTPIALSGHDIVCLRIAREAVRDTKVYPVEYDVFRSEVAFPGTRLLLRGCSAKLARAVAAGLTHFFHDGNPLLGTRRWSHWNGAFSIYDSTDGTGHVFYRKLKRGEIEGIPVVLVIDRSYEAIEKKIRQDRDRNAFGDALLGTFFNRFPRHGLKEAPSGQCVIVEQGRALWSRGHPLLNAVASVNGWHDLWPAKVVAEVFGAGYYARSSARDDQQRLRIESLERHWRDEGRTALPEYFKMFGVLNAERHLEDLRVKAAEEARRNHRRAPTPAEAQGIQILARVTRELTPAVMAIFDRKKTSYTVATTQAVLGELRQGQRHDSCEVFLAAEVFEADFASALATFLHEHSHVLGYDGSRGFTDALTELLETVVRERRSLDAYEAEWTTTRLAIIRERKRPERGDDKNALHTWLSEKDETELRELLERVPTAVLLRLKGDKKPA